MATTLPTTLLYHADPLLFSFDAQVVGHGVFGKKPSVLLDRSGFYPEAGGQMADRGTLAGLAVVDVQVDEAGVVHHIVEGALPVVGTQVHGQIDATRRRQFMAQHTAQHMLSRAVLDLANAETVSSRLGENVCTVDVQIEALSDETLQKAERRVNEVIDEDRAVRAFFPTPQELAALPLRRKPKVDENIRVVEVDGFDVSPCGGTHVTHTAQIGLVRVLGSERYKGLCRVSFVASVRAREQAFARARVLEQLGQGMSAQPEDVPAGIEKLRAELKATQQKNTQLQEELAASLATSILGRARDDVIVDVVLGDADLVRAVAARLVAARPSSTALLAGSDVDGAPVVCARGKESSFDCGAFLKRVSSLCGGKGGGKPDSAQGRIPAGVDWSLVARQALCAV